MSGYAGLTTSMPLMPVVAGGPAATYQPSAVYSPAPLTATMVPQSTQTTYAAPVVAGGPTDLTASIAALTTSVTSLTAVITQLASGAVAGAGGAVGAAQGGGAGGTVAMDPQTGYPQAWMDDYAPILAGSTSTTGAATGGGGVAGAKAGCACSSGASGAFGSPAPGTDTAQESATKARKKKARKPKPSTGSAAQETVTPTAQNTTKPAIASDKLRSDVLRIAAGEVGVKEEGNNGGARVNEFQSSAGSSSGAAWCASFASWVFNQAGHPLVDSNGDPLVANIGNWAKQQGTFHTPGWTPRPGDMILFYHAGGSNNWTNHIGIVETVDGDGTIHTIEGNASDQVKRNTYAANNSSIVGFIQAD